MTNIRRYPLNGAPVFITAVTAGREPFLQAVANKQLLLDIIREMQETYPFKMLGYVILHDHLHLMVRPDGDTLAKIVQSIKLRFTRGCFTEVPRPTRIWQARYWDHIIRDTSDFQRHLDYIHYNPVKRGVAPARLVRGKLGHRYAASRNSCNEF